MAQVAAHLCGVPGEAPDLGRESSGSLQQKYTVGAQHLLGVHSNLRHLLDTVKYDASNYALPQSEIRDHLKRAYLGDEPLSSIDAHRVPVQTLFARFMVDPFTGLLPGAANERHLLYGPTDDGKQQWKRLVKMRCTLPSMGGLKKPKKARKHFEKWESAVKEIEHSSSTVWRNKEVVYVKENEVVVGDIVFLSPGSKAAADIRIIACTPGAKVDASPVVGDSEFRGCSSEVSMNQILEATNLVLYGSFIVSGCILGVVFSVGEKSILGGKMSSLDRTSFPAGLAKKEKSAVLFAAAMISETGVVAKHVPAVMLLPRMWVLVVSVIPSLINQVCTEAPRFVDLGVSVILLFEGSVPEQARAMCEEMANSAVMSGSQVQKGTLDSLLSANDIVVLSNVSKITRTLIASDLTGDKSGDELVHDSVGYVGSSMDDHAAVETVNLGLSLSEDVATLVTKDAAGMILVKNDLHALGSAIEITRRTIGWHSRGRRTRKKRQARGKQSSGYGSSTSSPQSSPTYMGRSGGKHNRKRSPSTEELSPHPRSDLGNPGTPTRHHYSSHGSGGSSKCIVQ